MHACVHPSLDVVDTLIIEGVTREDHEPQTIVAFNIEAVEFDLLLVVFGLGSSSDGVNAGSGKGDFGVGGMLLDDLLCPGIYGSFAVDNIVEVSDVIGIVVGEEEADKIIVFLLPDPISFLIRANPLVWLVGGEVPAGSGI